MNKKIFKITAVALLAIIVIFVAGATYLINVVATPEKATPIINKAIKENLAGNCSIGSVDISYFSTFPDLAITIDSIVVADTSNMKVGSIESLTVEFRPLAYLLTKSVIIDKVSMIRPDANIVTNTNGTANYQFLIPNDTIQKDTSTTDTTKFTLKKYVSAIDLKNISITDGSFSFIDSLSNTASNITGLNISLSGSLLKKISTLNFMFSCDDANLTRDGLNTISNFLFKIDTNMEFNRDSLLFTINNADVFLRNIDLTTSGKVRINREKRGLDCNLDFQLAVASLEALMERLPKKYLVEGADFDASGSTKIEGKIAGLYSNDSIPSVDATFTLDDGKFKFDNMDYGVEELDLLAKINIDGNNQQNSSFSLEKAKLVSNAGVNISAKATGTDILDHCNINFNIDSDVELSKLSKILPISDAIIMEGKNQTKMSGNISLKDILNKNYGALFLDGKSNFKNFLFSVDGSKLPDSTKNSTYLYVEMENGMFNFGSKTKSLNASKGEPNLSADIAFSGVGYRNKEGLELTFSNVKMSAKSQLVTDTTKIVPVEGDIFLEKSIVTLTDTIAGYINTSNVKFSIKPYEKDERKAISMLYIRADSAGAYIIPAKADMSLDIASANINIIPDSTKKSGNSMDGIMGFNGLKFFSELFPLDIKMDRSKVSYYGNRVDLEHATIAVGNSNFTATGWMRNFIGNMLFNDDNIVSNLKISSEYIDLGEMYIASLASDTTSSEDIKKMEASLESNAKESLKIFTIPSYIQSKMDLNVAKVKFGDIGGENINGRVAILDTKMNIDSLNFKTLGSEMKLSAQYIPKADTLADAFFNLAAKRVKLDTLIAIMPSIDSLMPVLKSVEGIVDFDMTAKTEINKYMELDLPTLESVMSFKGEDLVLLDGETFAKVSKMLMFKNKKRNIIDSLSMDVVVRSGGIINVPPFEFEMDRYRAIIGGTQTVDFNNFDINYKYNVSIIKSPLPIKAGVDITGVNEDFQYKITKAKLKHSDFDQIQSNVDSLKEQLVREKNYVSKKLIEKGLK